jgi:AbrB family looped-hinge helix DNA binding protein
MEKIHTHIKKIVKWYRIVIPTSLRKKLHLEFGSLLTIEVEDGKITLIPVKAIPTSQLWFWSEQWQKEERRVDAELKKKGISKKSYSADELIKEMAIEKTKVQKDR